MLLLTICQVFCLSYIRFKETLWFDRFRFGLIVVLLLSSIMWAIRRNLTAFSNTNSVEKFFLLAIIGTSLTILIQSFWASQNERDFIIAVNEANRLVKIESGHVKVEAPSSFLIPLVVCCIFNVVPVICENSFLWEILMVPSVIITICSFQYACYVKMIRGMLIYIHVSIKQLKNKTDFVCPPMKRSMNLKASGDKQKMKFIMEMHNIVSQLTGHLNQRFGLSLVFIIFSSFLTATFCGYNFFVELETEMRWNVIIGNLITLISITTIFICNGCQKCINHVSKLPI